MHIAIGIQDVFGDGHLAQAIRVAGFGQELLGELGIVSKVLDSIVKAPHAGRDQGLGDLPGDAPEGLSQGRLVDSVGNGLAHLGVLELLDLVVEGQVDGIQRRIEEHLQLRIGLCSFEVLGGGLFHAVDIAGFEGQVASGGIRDDTPDDLLDTGRAAPVVGIGFDGDVVAFDPFNELERAGANCADGRGAVGCAVGFDRSRAGDGEHIHRQVGQEGRQRGAEGELDGVVIHLFDAGDPAGIIETAPHRLVVLEDLLGEVVGVVGEAPALEVEDHCIGIEVGAVVELDALAQGAGPLGGIFIGGALFSQCRDRVGGAGGEGVQVLQDLARDTEQLAIGDDGGIQADRIGAAAVDEGCRCCSRCFGHNRCFSGYWSLSHFRFWRCFGGFGLSRCLGWGRCWRFGRRSLRRAG